MHSEANLGAYNCASRHQAVHRSLDHSFKDIEKKVLTKFINPTSNNQIDSIFRGSGDSLKMDIERFGVDVRSFANDVKDFQGPCFNKQFRVLISTGQNLQCDLDKLDVSGSDEIRQNRKDLLHEIDNLIREVKSKVHPDGQLCDQCKVSVV